MKKRKTTLIILIIIIVVIVVILLFSGKSDSEESDQQMSDAEKAAFATNTVVSDTIGTHTFSDSEARWLSEKASQLRVDMDKIRKYNVNLYEEIAKLSKPGILYIGQVYNNSNKASLYKRLNRQAWGRGASKSVETRIRAAVSTIMHTLSTGGMGK